MYWIFLRCFKYELIQWSVQDLNHELIWKYETYKPDSNLFFV